MQLSIIVAALEGCHFEDLDDRDLFERALAEAVAAGGFQLLHQYVHQFEPQGVTGAAVLSESHIALHSWPEHGILFVDIATCAGAELTERAFERICELFAHTQIKRQNVAYQKDDFEERPSAAEIGLQSSTPLYH